MNQYTLSYLEKDLEDEYQISENSTSRYTMYKALSGASIGIALLRITLAIIHQNQLLHILPQILLIPFLLILAFILKRKPQYCWLGLIIFNTSLMYYQYEIDSAMDPYTAYLQGSNLMMAHCVVIFISDFKYSIIQVFILGGVRLGVTGIKNQQFDLYQFIITLAASIFYLTALYKVEKTKRLQYLQRLKENQWDQVITKIIVKPFVIFSFDKSKFSFIHKLSGDCTFCNTGEGLIKFLRQSQYRKKTLEQFIFNLQNKKNQRTQFTRTLLVQFEKKTINIRFSSFYLTENMFLIVFDDDSQKVKNIKQQCYNNYLTNQKIFLHSVISTYNHISKAFKSGNISYITKIQIQQLITYLTTKNSNIKKDQIKIKLIRVYKALHKLNQLLNQKIQFQQNDSQLKISTIPHQFILLLLESLSLFESQQIYITYQLSLDKELVLEIYGEQLKEHDFSKIKFPFLIKSIETFKSKTQDSALIIFHKKPQISFHRV